MIENFLKMLVGYRNFWIGVSLLTSGLFLCNVRGRIITRHRQFMCHSYVMQGMFFEEIFFWGMIENFLKMLVGNRNFWIGFSLLSSESFLCNVRGRIITRHRSFIRHSYVMQGMFFEEIFFGNDREFFFKC